MAPMLAADEPLAALERAIVDEFLQSRGYTRDSLRRLPRRLAEQVLAEAAEEASMLLAQIDARSSYLPKLDLPKDE